MGLHSVIDNSVVAPLAGLGAPQRHRTTGKTGLDEKRSFSVRA